jgi:hypothetical protein
MPGLLKGVIAIPAAQAVPRPVASHYPEAFAIHMQGRVKHPLGDVFGLSNLGVNLTRAPPGAVSSLHRRHSRQDEFIYVLEGRPTLVTDGGEMELRRACAPASQQGAWSTTSRIHDEDGHRDGEGRDGQSDAFRQRPVLLSAPSGGSAGRCWSSNRDDPGVARRCSDMAGSTSRPRLTVRSSRRDGP